jgi:hypothetical protein
LLALRVALVLAFVACGAAGPTACAPRPKMCTASADCASQSACVAGRCQPDRPGVKPAIDNARRLVVRAVDLAYVRPGDGPSGGELPPHFTLGRDRAVLLLRFAAPVTPTTNVVEAYLVLRRSDAVDDDPSPVSLHATRIVEAWNGRSTSWALQPRTVETKTPSTTVDPGGPSLVRLDVRDVVREWARRDPSDHGLAVRADTSSRSGMTFAFRAVGGERPTELDGLSGGGPSVGPRAEVRSSSAPDAEPYLELYVR